MRKSRSYGALQIIIAAIGFGFLGIFGKIAFASGLSIGELLFFRFALAALLLWIYMLLFNRSAIVISATQLLICAGLGIFGYAVFATLYFGAIQGVSASLAALLLYTYPAMVTIGARFLFKEHISKIQWCALPIAMSGLLVLLWGNTTVQSWSAVVMGVGSATCYAFYILASSHWQKNISPMTSGLYVISFAALALELFHRPNLGRILQLSPPQMMVILGIAIISTIMPLVLFLAGLQKLKNADASILSTVEPMTAALAAYLILGETMSLLQICGGVLILMSLTMTVLAPQQQSAPAVETLLT